MPGNRVHILFTSIKSDKCDVGDHITVRLKEHNYLPKICKVVSIEESDSEEGMYIYRGYIVSKEQ